MAGIGFTHLCVSSSQQSAGAQQLLAKGPSDLNPDQRKPALPQRKFVNSFVHQVILEKHSPMQ